MKRVVANIPEEIHTMMKAIKEKSGRSFQWQIIRALKTYTSKKLLGQNGKQKEN